jgi:hypothetical protein
VDRRRFQRVEVCWALGARRKSKAVRQAFQLVTLAFAHRRGRTKPDEWVAGAVSPSSGHDPPQARMAGFNSRLARTSKRGPSGLASGSNLTLGARA